MLSLRGINSFGENMKKLTFVINGENHYADVLATTERQTVVIDTAVDFDSSLGAVLSPDIERSFMYSFSAASGPVVVGGEGV